MFPHVIPPVFKADQIAGQVPYICPTCHVQSTAEEADPGWVNCPMVDNKPICLSCCIDFQKAARADDFEDHPLFDLFDDLSRTDGRLTGELRKLCLLHQEHIVEKDQEELLATIQRAMKQVRGE